VGIGIGLCQRNLNKLCLEKMKAVITVIGKDTTGIIAKVSQECYKLNVNILDITQKVLDDTFAMIMMVDTKNMTGEYTVLVDNMNNLAKETGLVIHTMHEDIFNSMHRI